MVKEGPTMRGGIEPAHLPRDHFLERKWRNDSSEHNGLYLRKEIMREKKSSLKLAYYKKVHKDRGY
jgi:hypothetical protein